MGGFTSFRRSVGFKMHSDNPGHVSSPGVNDVRWDPETGRPIGQDGPPSHDQAQAYQYRSDEVVARRNADLRNQAAGFLRQGTNLSESFRPGGATSLLQGNYRAQAQVAMASQIDETDQLTKWRDEQAYRARKSQKRSQNLQLGVQLAGAALTAFAPPLGAAAAVTAAGANFAANGAAPLGSPGPGGTQQLGPGYGSTGQPDPYSLGSDPQMFGGGNAGAMAAPGEANPGASAAIVPTTPGGGGEGSRVGDSGQPGGASKGGGSGATDAMAYDLAVVQHVDATDDGFDDFMDFGIRELTGIMASTWGK